MDNQKVLRLNLWKVGHCTYRDGRLIPFEVGFFSTHVCACTCSTVPASARNTSEMQWWICQLSSSHFCSCLLHAASWRCEHLVMLVNSLTFWNLLIVHNILVTEEKNRHHLLSLRTWHAFTPESWHSSIEQHLTDSAKSLYWSVQWKIVTVFWDHKHIILDYFIDRWEMTMCGTYCSVLANHQKPSGWNKFQVLSASLCLQHDIAHPHTAHFALKMIERRFCLKYYFMHGT